MVSMVMQYVAHKCEVDLKVWLLYDTDGYSLFPLDIMKCHLHFFTMLRSYKCDFKR